MSTLTERPFLQKSLAKTDKKKIMVLLCSVLMFSVMNGTMFMIAVPDIAKHFSLLPSQVSWVVTGYIIVYAVGALLYGKLADLFPVKTLMTIGLSLFAAGSVLGFIAPMYIMVVAARMIQAAGAAAIPALVFIAPTRYFPGERGKVLGILSSTMAFASGIGPVIGGFIAGAWNWKYLFLISFFVLITIPFFRAWLPEEEKREGKVDIPGALWMACAMTSLILFITSFQWWFLVVSLFFMVMFTLRIFKTDDPFIRPDLFKNVAFRIGILTSFLGIITMFSMMFMLPLLLHEVNGLSTMTIGLVLFPGAMSAALVGRVTGNLTDSMGSRSVVYIACCIMITGFILQSVFIGSAAWIMSIVLIVSFMAFPFFQTSTASLISGILPGRQIGIGMGIYNLCNFMSGAFGGAIIGKILDHSYSDWTFIPFARAEGAAAVYSNLFVGMAILALTSAVIFHFFFRQERFYSYR